MGQVFEHEEAVAHGLVRLLTLEMRDEADAASIVLVSRIVEPPARQPGPHRVPL